MCTLFRETTTARRGDERGGKAGTAQYGDVLIYRHTYVAARDVELAHFYFETFRVFFAGIPHRDVGLPYLRHQRNTSYIDIGEATWG